MDKRYSKESDLAEPLSESAGIVTWRSCDNLQVHAGLIASMLVSTRIDEFGDVVPVEDSRNVTESLAAACNDLRRAVRRMPQPDSNVPPATGGYDPEHPY